MAGLMSGEWSPAKVLFIQNEALVPIHLLIEARHIVQNWTKEFRGTLTQADTSSLRISLEVRLGDDQVMSTLDRAPNLVPLLPVNLGISPTTWTLSAGQLNWSVQARIILHLKVSDWTA